MNALVYLRREDGRYRAGEEEYTAAEAADLLTYLGDGYQYAVVSRFDGSIVADPTPQRLAPYGQARPAEELAAEIWVPDWHCTVCGCSGKRGSDCGCDCTGALGTEVHSR